MNDYPSPCEGCDKKKFDSCAIYYRCPEWLTRYRYKQKQINAYHRKVNTPIYERMDGFAYDPITTKEFVENGPCAKCDLEPNCDTICEARALWWDMRIELLKKAVEA